MTETKEKEKMANPFKIKHSKAELEGLVRSDFINGTLKRIEASASFIETVHDEVWRFQEFATNLGEGMKTYTFWFDGNLNFCVADSSFNKLIKYGENLKWSNNKLYCNCLSVIASKILKTTPKENHGKNLFGDIVHMNAATVADNRRKIWKGFTTFLRTNDDLLALKFLVPNWKQASVFIKNIEFRKTTVKTGTETLGNISQIVTKRNCPITITVDGIDLPFILSVQNDADGKWSYPSFEYIALCDENGGIYCKTEHMEVAEFVKAVPQLIKNIV